MSYVGERGLGWNGGVSHKNARVSARVRLVITYGDGSKHHSQPKGWHQQGDEVWRRQGISASTAVPFFKEPDTFVLPSVTSGSHCVAFLGLTFFLGKGSDIHLWHSTIKRAIMNTEWMRGS